MISSLAITNFKCFSQQSFDLAPLTVLSGTNGSGKSTVLQSLLLLRQSYRSQALQRNALLLNGDLVRIGRGKDALNERAEDTSITMGLSFVDGNTARWSFEYAADADVLIVQDSNNTAPLDQFSLFNQHFQYLEAERTGPRSTYEMAEYLVSDPAFLGTRGEFAEHYLSRFELNDVRNQAVQCPGSNSTKLRDQVEAWLSRMTPGIRIHLVTDPSIDVVKLRYSFVLKHSTSDQYRSTNVGFGITYVLPIVVAILSAEAGSLLLLENPEAHLHPDAQFEIGTLLALAANNGMQILVETHSDHILNSIRLAVHNGLLAKEKASFYFFRRTPDSFLVERPTIDGRGRFDRWPAGFYDRWEKALEALID